MSLHIITKVKLCSRLVQAQLNLNRIGFSVRSWDYRNLYFLLKSSTIGQLKKLVKLLRSHSILKTSL